MSNDGAKDGDGRERGGDGLKATVEFAREAGIGITGLSWLVLLYVISLGSAFIILSATVFQSTTIQDSADQAGDVLKVLRIIPEREAYVVDQLDVTRRTVLDMKQTLRALEATRQQAENRLSDLFGDVVEAAAELDVKVGRSVGPSNDRDPAEWDWRSYAVHIEIVIDELIRTSEDDDDRDALQSIRDRLVPASASALAAATEIKRAAHRYNDLSVLFRLETQELDRLRKQSDSIRDEVFKEYEIKANVQANVSQVLNTNVSVLIYLVQLPSEFLTFALTVSMGLLGSTIHMSRELFRDGERRDGAITVTWFVARPLEGMAAAIIIYIFFRAGQLTLTGGSTADNKIDDLNPYVLSFLAIASGLLSEKAYNRIVVGARRMLGGEDAERKAEAAADIPTLFPPADAATPAPGPTVLGPTASGPAASGGDTRQPAAPASGPSETDPRSPVR